MTDKKINLIMKLLMALMLGYFAYFKGWIFSDSKNVSPREAYTLLEQSNTILVLDVRSKKEFEKDHIKGAISTPLNTLSKFKTTSKELLVYSERGILSVDASRILSRKGYNILNLEGGVVFWIRAGYTVVK